MLGLLEEQGQKVHDLDTLLEFTLGLRRLVEELEDETANMKAYLLSNYRLAAGLVKDIYHLKETT